MLRGVFIADGTSDAPLGQHLERLCSRNGIEVAITSPDPAMLAAANVGCTVHERLNFLRTNGDYDVYFVHRDAEAEDPARRDREVVDAAERVGISRDAVVAVVPRRMTEAWLLLDEGLIRSVAGKPTGRRDLGLPTVKEAERVADPKGELRAALLTASEAKGRRGRRVQQDFGRHRRLLIQRLDIDGGVNQLPSWQALVASVNRWADHAAGRARAVHRELDACARVRSGWE